MMFTPYNSDFGFTRGGTDYTFDQVDSCVVEDPEQLRITRGANRSNKVGIAYREGVKEPKSMTVTLVGISKEMFDLLTAIHNGSERIDAWAIDRPTGSSKYAKQSVLCQAPRQLTIDETTEAMNVVLRFETFDLADKLKEA